MDIKKVIGEKIKESRLKKGWTQEKLADETQLSRTYISDIENARYIPSISTLVNIASHLNINLDFLNQNDGNTSEGDVNDDIRCMELSK